VALLMPAGADADASLYVAAATGSDAGNDCLSNVEPCATIQHAIDQASARDTIVVRPGTYVEQLTVTKQLTLQGPNWDRGINGNRELEAIIDGGGGVAITPEADNVVVGGFTLTSNGPGVPVQTTGADVNALKIEDSIVEGDTTAIRLDAGGEKVAIERDVIKGEEYGIYLGGAEYTELAIENSRLSGSPASVGIFDEASTLITGFTMSGNELDVASNLEGYVEQGELNHNVFELNSPGAVALKVNLFESRAIDNSFRGHGTSGCFELLGSQGGQEPSAGATISASDFAGCTFGVQLDPDVEAINVVDNIFTGAYDGVRASGATPWNIEAGENEVFFNRIVGTTHLGVNNEAEGILDAPENWWGCNAGPGAAGCDAVSAGVETSPQIVLTAAAWEVEKFGGELHGKAITEVSPGGKALITASLDTNSEGEPAFVPTGSAKATFSSSNGTFTPSSVEWNNDRSLSSYTAGGVPGSAGILVTMDNQQVSVPLTVLGSSPSAPIPPPAIAPTVSVPRRIVTATTRGATLGEIHCGSSACDLVLRSAVAVVGQRMFRVKTVGLPHRLDQDAATTVRVALPGPVLKALRTGKTARLAVAVVITDASGQRLARTIRVRAKLNP
jgi:nitrous oxidase accessory protein NosD